MEILENIFSLLFTFYAIKIEQTPKKNSSLEKNVIKVFHKFHMLIQDSNWEITVQKIKL